MAKEGVTGTGFCDPFSLFRASQGESQRHTDEVTLRKLIDEGLLISTQDGYKLSDRYYEIAKNVGTVEDNRKDDTVNIPVNDTVKLPQLTERQHKIYEVIKIGSINVPNNVPNNVPVNAPNLATWLNVSEKTIKRDLIAMQSLGVIRHIGPTNGGHWEFIPEK